MISITCKLRTLMKRWVQQHNRYMTTCTLYHLRYDFTVTRTIYPTTKSICYLCGKSHNFTFTVKFVADQVCSFLRKQDKNHRLTHADSQEATANLEMSILSEQLQENEQEIHRTIEEEDTAAYTTLNHSSEEIHVQDVI